MALAFGGYTVKTTCPSASPAHNPAMCIYGGLNLVQGSDTMLASGKTKDTAQKLGGSAGGAGYSCYPDYEYCRMHPYDKDCQNLICQLNPSDEKCPPDESDYCDRNPDVLWCLCDTYPDDPRCDKANPPPGSVDDEHCKKFPSDPQCNESTLDCSKNPDKDNNPICEICITDPNNPICDLIGECEKNPSSCDDQARKIISDPNLCPGCSYNPNDGKGSFTGPNGTRVSYPYDKKAFENAGFTEEEIETAFNEMENTSRKYSNGNLFSKKKFTPSSSSSSSYGSGEEGNGSSSSGSDSSATGSELTGGSGGMGSFNREGSDQEDEVNFFKDLQKSMNRGKNKNKGRNMQGFQPKQLGKDKVGTTHDNIFEMVSRSYRSRSKTNNVYE